MMRPNTLLALCLSLVAACSDDGGVVDSGPTDGQPGAEQPGPDGAPNDAGEAGPPRPDAGPPCSPPLPALSDHIDDCLLAHRPEDPQHLSNRRPDPTTPVTVRLQTQAGDVDQVVLRIWTGVARELPMTREQSSGPTDTYVAEVPPSARPVYYRFRLTEGSATLHLTRSGPATAPKAGDDFFIAPAASGKTIHYRTDFLKPEIWYRATPDGSYSKQAMVSEGSERAGVSWIGTAGSELFFHVRDQASGSQDHPPGGEDYRLRPDVDEGWLQRGTLFDQPPETIELGLIDAHTHPYDNGFVYDPQPMTTLLPAAGITRALSMAPGGLATQKSKLQALHASQRWIVPLVWVSPSSNQVADVEALLLDGFAGLKFHPTVSGYPADGALMDPFLQLAAKHRVPVQIHSATDDDAKPARVVALAKRHPRVPIVMVHTELGAIDKTAVLDLIKPVPNIYAETSWTNPQSILQAMNALDSSRTLFGTDATVDGYQHFTKTSIANPQGQYVYTIPQVIAEVQANAHPDAYANWAYLTAIRLYGWRFSPDPDLYDTDGDGQPDQSDTDDDNDGIPDAIDPAPRDPGA